MRSGSRRIQHAEATYLLARRGGEVVGRISAHVDHRFNEFQDNRWGCFGFFECVDDARVAGALLDEAEAWLSERGRDRMVGPLDFSTNHECGLLVEGHELMPQILENWHHPYYRSLLEALGMSKAMDMYKWQILTAEHDRVLPVIYELAGTLEAKHGIRVRNMRKRDFEAEVRRFMDVYNAAWEHNWGFVPLTDSEPGRCQGGQAGPRRALRADRRKGRRGGRRGACAARHEQAAGQAQRPPAAAGMVARPARAQPARRGPRVRPGRQARAPAYGHGRGVLRRDMARVPAPPNPPRRDRLDPRGQRADEPRHAGAWRRHRQALPALRARDLKWPLLARYGYRLRRSA